MTKYAYFNPFDGCVLQWIDTEAQSYNLPDKQYLRECDDAEWASQDDGPRMVKDGKLVAYVPPKISTEYVKSSMWEKIKAERSARKLNGVNVAGKWFDTDADSRIQHLGLKDKARDLITLGGALSDKLIVLGQPIKWKTMGGEFIDITGQLAFDIVAAVGDLDALLFVTAETHKAKMEASKDPTTYDFSGGWPPSYMDSKTP